MHIYIFLSVSLSLFLTHMYVHILSCFITHAVFLSCTFTFFFTHVSTYLVIVPENKRDPVGLKRLKVLEVHFRGKWLAQWLVNVHLGKLKQRIINEVKILIANNVLLSTVTYFSS